MGIEFVGRVYQSVCNEGTGWCLGLPSVVWRELILHWEQRALMKVPGKGQPGAKWPLVTSFSRRRALRGAQHTKVVWFILGHFTKCFVL